MVTAQTASTSVFRRGIPTKVDTEKLDKVFGVPSVGVKITWQEFEKALQMNKGTYRFQTVVSTWRKQLYATHNVLLKAESGIGLYVANNSQRVNTAGTCIQSARRQIAKGGNIAAQTDDDGLSDDEKKARTYICRCAAQLQLAEATQPKPLLGVE